MSQCDMASLKSLSGAGFDQMFLTTMFKHHQGGIEMVKTEASSGRFAAATALAGQIETAQAKEIATMRLLLR